MRDIVFESRCRDRPVEDYLAYLRTLTLEDRAAWARDDRALHHRECIVLGAALEARARGEGPESTGCLALEAARARRADCDLYQPSAIFPPLSWRMDLANQVDGGVPGRQLAITPSVLHDRLPAVQQPLINRLPKALVDTDMADGVDEVLASDRAKFHDNVSLQCGSDKGATAAIASDSVVAEDAPRSLHRSPRRGRDLDFEWRQYTERFDVYALENYLSGLTHEELRAASAWATARPRPWWPAPATRASPTTPAATSHDSSSAVPGDPQMPTTPLPTPSTPHARARAHHRPRAAFRCGASRAPDADVSLVPTEALVLRLIHLDPRLTTEDHRDRLVHVAGLCGGAQSAARLGRVLDRLQRWSQAAAITTDAFVVGPRAPTPTLGQCRRCFNAWVSQRHAGGSMGSAETAWPRFAQAFGHAVALPALPSASAPLAHDL